MYQQSKYVDTDVVPFQNVYFSRSGVCDSVYTMEDYVDL